ncbi:unnamed protein product [Kluyveromyces dobzhanskii CBS 2104]|uniref:WGS project CCBQ000000000 data, contig 00099 n=1 Tax=Kluyveromyces dobzhanskii CBS 2104 TaxID=1427455 RepID=A0A0A8L2K3_9SACH|nr:unnamed protein product [Kluyveromyces dobzhanskii CBS 2104]
MSDFESLKIKGNSAYKQNQFNDAVDFYKKAITHDPNNPVGYSNCAMALIQLKKFEDALQMCQRGLFYFNEQPSRDNKIGEKLKWRLDLCSEQLKDNLVAVKIHEVDELPKKYQNL